jgi:microcystin-dependent protein
MTSPYLGEIRMTAFPFAPRGWVLCSGQLLSIQQNAALFSILGTTYGGNGTSTFQLPNLQGRVPVHQGNGVTLGDQGGEATHALIVPEMPVHTHLPQAAASASVAAPAGAVFAPGPAPIYSPSPDSTMSPSAIGQTGSGQPHENRNPYQVVNFIIALTGIFPSRQ